MRRLSGLSGISIQLTATLVQLTTVFILITPDPVFGGDEQDGKDRLRKLPPINLGDYAVRPARPIPNEARINVPLPKVPSALVVFEARNPVIDEGVAEAFMRKAFSLGPNETVVVRKRRGRVLAEAAGWEARFGKTADRWTIRRLAPPEKELPFPTLDEAAAIATRFIRTHKVVPDDAILTRAVDNRRAVNAISVGFKRVLNGIDVIGPGARLIVEVGPGGKVIEVYGAWQSLKPVGRYPLCSALQAFTMLRSGKALFEERPGKKESAAKLVYFALPEGQKYLRPVYAFEFSTGPRGADDEKVWAYVDALWDDLIVDDNETK